MVVKEVAKEITKGCLIPCSSEIGNSHSIQFLVQILHRFAALPIPAMPGKATIDSFGKFCIKRKTGFCPFDDKFHESVCLLLLIGRFLTSSICCQPGRRVSNGWRPFSKECNDWIQHNRSIIWPGAPLNSELPFKFVTFISSLKICDFFEMLQT